MPDDPGSEDDGEAADDGVDDAASADDGGSE